MGKPRLIIVVRHAQSEGNKNRAIHQMIPDHRVKLTDQGWRQAEEAGRQLRSMLKPDDRIQFFTSPYRRTRETTEGILRTLTADDPTPSPFPHHTIKVYEEPRLREQDFGNFQPCSDEMERMWQERADYGHFFYRIPNGESAADAYDRVSGFNESLWRSFSEEDFPSVCVLVTHGLMTRVFLMKWYHWSVEYFEDLRNINHCEFIVMSRSPENGKYILQNQLRTWSELKRRAAAEGKTNGVSRAPSLTAPPTMRKWGGCAQGCNHSKLDFPRRARRMNTQDIAVPTVKVQPATTMASSHNHSHNHDHHEPSSPEAAHDGDASNDDEPGGTSDDEPTSAGMNRSHQSIRLGRDGGGSRSGMATPTEIFSDDSDYFKPAEAAFASRRRPNVTSNGGNSRSKPMSNNSIDHLALLGGLGSGARANTLGDQSDFDGDGELSPELRSAALARAVKQTEVEEAEKADRSLRGSVY